MKKILIIEDDESLSEMLKEIINAFGGVEVSIAHNASEAIKLTTNNNYDLMFVDIKLPDRDGTTIIPEIENDEKIKSIKILISEYHNEIVKEKIKGTSKCNICDFMEKPIYFNDLKSILMKYNMIATTEDDFVYNSNASMIEAHNILSKSNQHT